MEGALLTLSRKIAGNDGAAPFGEFDRADAIPFDAAYRYMAVLHRASDGGAIVHVKGAPEAVLAMCNDQRAPSKRPAARLPPQRRDSWGAP